MDALDQRLEAIRQAPPGPQTGAFFDYDGTLIDGFSAGAYFSQRIRKGEVGLAEFVELLKLLQKGEPTDEEFLQIISDGVAAWTGMRDEECAAMWQKLFKNKISRWLFPEGYWLVAEHFKAGHTVAIASSATRYQVIPLAREYGIEHLLCTEVGVKRGIVNGNVIGTPPWGLGKAQAVKTFAKKQKVDLKQSFGYANGNEDIEFLSSVAHPVAVNPKPRLAALAQEKSWPRLDFEMRKRAPLSAVAGTVRAYTALAGTFALGYAYEKITGNTRAAADMIGSVGGELALMAAGIDIDIRGEQNLWVERPAVFILNHQSKLEFFLFLKLLRRGMSGVAKKEAANTPGFGPFMRMSDFAFLDRENTRSAIDALKPAVERLQRGLSVVMAPEGTRSYSPRVGAFKKGAFHMAIQAGVPIVPVVFRNVAALMPRDAQVMRPGTAQIAVLPPISVADWKPEELDERVAEVRQLYVDMLADWPQSDEDISKFEVPGMHMKSVKQTDFQREQKEPKPAAARRNRAVK